MRTAILIAALLAATGAAAQTPPPAPMAKAPATPAMRAARQEARKDCAADVAKFCPGQEPGAGHLGQCLRAHKTELSEPCRQAMVEMRQARAASGAQPQR